MPSLRSRRIAGGSRPPEPCLPRSRAAISSPRPQNHRVRDPRDASASAGGRQSSASRVADRSSFSPGAPMLPGRRPAFDVVHPSSPNRANHIPIALVQVLARHDDLTKEVDAVPAIPPGCGPRLPGSTRACSSLRRQTAAVERSPRRTNVPVIVDSPNALMRAFLEAAVTSSALGTSYE